MIDTEALLADLHNHPQVAGNEQFAHNTVQHILSTLHPNHLHTHVGGYGVVAVWGDDPNRPTIAFRADTDALPIGHRCGHDGHTTILLRLAEMVAQHKPVDHNVLLLWQPAEETGTGAQAVIESGVLQQYNIARFYALHNLPGYELGNVVLCNGTFAAASTGVVYTLTGRPTHASTPELGLNPGLAVADVVQRISALGSTGNCFRQTTLICIRLGDEAFGTSAGAAEVMFTLRAYTNADMQALLREADNIVQQAATQHHLKHSRRLVEPFSATENMPLAVQEIAHAAQRAGLPVVYQPQPNRWSEDFGRYLEHWSGAMCGIGSGIQQPELHNPQYHFPHLLVEPAARLFATLSGCD